MKEGRPSQAGGKQRLKVFGTRRIPDAGLQLAECNAKDVPSTTECTLENSRLGGVFFFFFSYGLFRGLTHKSRSQFPFHPACLFPWCIMLFHNTYSIIIFTSYLHVLVRSVYYYPGPQ